MPKVPATSDTTRDEPEAARERRTSAPRDHLFVVIVADLPATGGARYALAGIDVVRLGRAELLSSLRRTTPATRELAIGVPARTMSTHHARIERRGSSWVLRDEGSRNGTYVNGARVTDRELRDGDVLEMGRAFMVVRLGLDTPDDSPMDVASHDLAGEPPGFRTLLPALDARYSALRRIARSQVPILVLGPTGAGKEVLARAIHAASAREGDFVAVNCGALPAPLVESLLFGHVKGAFSGALRDEKGFVRSADGGTLLLDEIGDLPLASQTVLLRMLQEREIVPLGATRAVKVDVRVLAATHRPIDVLVDAGDFRLDLLARLNGFTHRLPALEERREDLGLLVAELLPEMAGPLAPSVTIEPSVARAFLRYRWPLNVRELHHCLSAACMLATNGSITAADLPESELARIVRGGARPEGKGAGGASRSLSSPITESDMRTRDDLLAHLRASGGNVTSVAKAMGKAPFQIRRWMKRFGIDANRFR